MQIFIFPTEHRKLSFAKSVFGHGAIFLCLPECALTRCWLSPHSMTSSGFLARP
jgi:hypothetical protein